MIIPCIKCSKKFVDTAIDGFCDSCRADVIEDEFHNRDIVIDEQDQISFEEVRRERQERQQWEDSVL